MLENNPILNNSTKISLFQIFKNHFDEKTFDHNLNRLTLFATDNGLPKYKNEFVLSMKYNGIFKTKINDHKYEINYYDIVESNKTIIMFGYDSDPDKYCISLKVDKSEPDILHIISVESLEQCYKSTNKSDFNKKKGSVLMQIIIKWAKENNYKKIYLDDISTYKCDTENQTIYYDMKHVHTLTDGYPWYYKFGFKFVNKLDRIRTKENYNKLKLIKTSDISFVNIIRCITKYTIDDSKYKYFSDKETIINLHNLTSLYEKHYESNIMLFFKKVSYESCIMMSLLWNYVYELLGLDKYQTQTMVLELV